VATRAPHGDERVEPLPLGIGEDRVLPTEEAVPPRWRGELALKSPDRDAEVVVGQRVALARALGIRELDTLVSLVRRSGKTAS